MKNSLDIAKGQNFSVSLYNVLIPMMIFFICLQCIQVALMDPVRLLTQLSSEPVAMKRPHGETAEEQGWQRFTWFS